MPLRCSIVTDRKFPDVRIGWARPTKHLARGHMLLTIIVMWGSRVTQNARSGNFADKTGCDGLVAAFIDSILLH